MEREGRKLLKKVKGVRKYRREGSTRENKLKKGWMEGRKEWKLERRGRKLLEGIKEGRK